MTLILRPAAEGDARLLFDWVNSPDSLAGKLHTSGPIPWTGHVTWLGRMLADPSARIWIVEDAGAAVGQVRLSCDTQGRRLVDIYLVPVARGAGRAAKAVSLALAEARQLWPGTKVVAEILVANTPSQRLFQGLGFDLVYKDAHMHAYEFRIAGASS